MPAVELKNISSAKPLSQPPLEFNSKSILQKSSAPRGFEGEGFPVKRAFAGIDLSLLDPFIMMDEMGEVDYAPGEPKGTSWHPHRGQSTFTYMIDGIMDHSDSLGNSGTITDGSTQWMTAGSGILHKEAPPESLVQAGGLFHGLQLWVNLSSKDKLTKPNYQDLDAHSVKFFTSADGGSFVRLIAGELEGIEGPGYNSTPITFIHTTIAAGEKLVLPWNKNFNTLVYVMNGSGKFGKEAVTVKAGTALVLGRGSHIEIQADKNQSLSHPNLDVILVGGKPIGEPIAWDGPFVMNYKHEIQSAYEDYQKGRFGIPGV